MTQKTEVRPSTPRYFFVGPLLASVGCVLLLSSIFQESGSIAFFGRKNDSDLPMECFNATDPPSQVVFMVIDAWKYDFLASPSSPMEFVRSQVAAGKGVQMRSVVQVPTVTQPRIKALTGGVNPSFAALLANFFSSSMEADTWLSQARVSGKRLLFYGDDTWQKLFPGYFVDSLGVPSFNVLDFTEVDSQVTRRMREQIRRDDWDVMILHYLGLDHIGHSLGGESAEIPRKLREMDDIIREVFLSGRNLTIVVLGDHGMTLQGSHGGSHTSETQTPVVVLRTGASPVASRLPAEVPTIQQVDVVSLMSFLLKQPLPSSSVGVSVLPSLQRFWSLPDRQVIFDFLLHLPQWGSADDERASYLTGILRRSDRSCSQLARDFDFHVLREFHERTRTLQKEMLSQRQEIGGTTYNFGIALLLAVGFRQLEYVLFKGATVSFWSTRASFAGWDSLLLLLPVLCTASSSFVEEEHDVWYYCASGTVSLFIWKRGGCPSTVLKCLLILALHRFASSANAGIRRRWSMDSDLLPGLLWEDAPLFLPMRSFGDRIQAVVFPTSEGSLVGGLYMFLLAVLTKYDSAGHGSWVAFILQATAAVCYLGGWLSWLDSVIYASSWCWMFLLWLAPSSAIILFISFIIRPTFIPVLFSTYTIGTICRQVNLSQSAIASLITSSLFYTGLSNSISSIDIRAGYGGILEYHPAIVGMQILVGMYAPFLLFLLGLRKPYIVGDTFRHLSVIRISMVAGSALFLILFTDHLFIWSVFTPKAIFDCFHMFVLFLCTCAYFIPVIRLQRFPSFEQKINI